MNVRVSVCMASVKARLNNAYPLLLIADVVCLLAVVLGSQFLTSAWPWHVLVAASLCSLIASVIVIVALRQWAFGIFQAAFIYWYMLPILAASWNQEVFLDNDGTRFTRVDEIAQAIAAVFVAKLIFTLAYTVIAHRKQNQMVPVTVVPRPWIFGMQVILGVLPFFLVSNPLLQIMAARAGDLAPQGQKVTASTMFLELLFFLASSALLASYLFLVSSGAKRMLYGTMFFLASAVMVVMGGTRTHLLLYAMPALTLYVMTKGLRRSAVVLITSALVLYFAANMLVARRDLGFGSLPNYEQQGDRNFVDNDQFSELVFSKAVIPSERSFSYESPLFYVVTGFVPRTLWPSKPDPVNAEFVMRLRMSSLADELMGNITPGILGQYWDASGWLGIATCGLWLGIAAGFIEGKLRSPSLHIKFCWLVAAWSLFISFRGITTANVTPFILCWLTFKLSERFPRVGIVKVPRIFRLA